MRRIQATIEGIAPGLLQHRFADVTIEELKDAVKPANKSHPTPEEEFEMSVYRRQSDNAVVQPGEHIYQAMVKAAADFQIQGRGKKTYKDDIKGSLLIEPAIIVHEIQATKVDIRPVRIQRARIVRHRPWLPEWRLSFEIVLLDDNVPVEVVQAILERAGAQVGIGDYRPRFGRWIVMKFEWFGLVRRGAAG